MSKLIVHSGLRVSQSMYGGFGVFTDEPIKANSIVEQCPALVMSGFSIDQLPILLQRYVYNWTMDKNPSKIVVLLGNGMIYNHRDKNNLLHISELLFLEGETKMIITFYADRDIDKGEELFSNYGDRYFNHFDIPKID